MLILTLLKRNCFLRLDTISYERLNRYEDLLYKVLDYVFKKISEGEVKIIDTKPVETKELIRSNRSKKRGESKIIREEE